MSSPPASASCWRLRGSRRRPARWTRTSGAPHFPGRRPHPSERDAVDRGAARRAAAEYCPRDAGGRPGGASAMTAGAKRRQDLARPLEGAGGGEPRSREGTALPFGRRSATSAGVGHFPTLVDVSGLGGTLVATRSSLLRHSHQLPRRLRSRLRFRCHRRVRQTPSRLRRLLHRHQSRCLRRTQHRRPRPRLRHRFRTPSHCRFPPRNLRQRARGPEARLPAAQTADRARSWATLSAGNPRCSVRSDYSPSKLNASAELMVW
jgi:hypothetical protein